jgi:hypothetical protein
VAVRHDDALLLRRLSSKANLRGTCIWQRLGGLKPAPT